MVFPEHFVNKEIPKGEYEIFTHKGKMDKTMSQFLILDEWNEQTIEERAAFCMKCKRNLENLVIQTDLFG